MNTAATRTPRTQIAMIAAVAVAAVMAAGFVAHAGRTSAASLPVVELATVVVIGHRAAPDAADATAPVIQLPTVVVVGKRSDAATLLAERGVLRATAKSDV